MFGVDSKVDVSRVDFDLVLTSPPFWRDDAVLQEWYKHCEMDYSKFLQESLIPIVQKCLKRNVWVCLHLPGNMYHDLKKIFGKARKVIKINKNPSKQTRHDNVYCWKN